MENKQKVQEWLDAMGSAKKVDLTLDEDGVCAFTYETVQCDLQVLEKSDVLYLISPLAEMPQEGSEAVFIRLLEENYHKVNTREASYAIDPEYKRVVLIYEHAIRETDTGEEFVNVLSNFLQAARDCQRELQGILSGDAPSEGRWQTPQDNIVLG